MKETTTYKLIPLLLAILVFTASTGVVSAWSTCHCYEQEVTMLEETAHSCCSAPSASVEPHSCIASHLGNNNKEGCTKTFSKGCCGGKKLLIDNIKASPVSKAEFLIKLLPFLQKNRFIASNYELIQQPILTSIGYEYYSPPLLYKDIPVLIQSFLL